MTLTKEQFFMDYAPQFNFELNADQLIKEALKRGSITEVSKGKYLINENY